METLVTSCAAYETEHRLPFASAVVLLECMHGQAEAEDTVPLRPLPVVQLAAPVDDYWDDEPQVTSMEAPPPAAAPEPPLPPKAEGKRGSIMPGTSSLPGPSSGGKFNLSWNDDAPSTDAGGTVPPTLKPRGSGKSLVRFDPEALREASTVEHIEQAHATNFAAHARFSSYAPAGGEDDAERKTSAPAKLKSRKDSLAGLTKEEVRSPQSPPARAARRLSSLPPSIQRLAKRKASMRAGDTWEDLHGTKDRPQREVSKARAEKLAELAAAHGVAPADVAAAIDWSEAPAAPSSDGAGPSSDGDVDVDIEQPADPELRQRV
jgi:hypothetical protein